MMIRKLWHDIFENPFQKRILLILFFINILGSVYGYYWYWSQLNSTEYIYWLFVPDSPLSTTLLAMSLFLFLRYQNIPYLPLVACASVIKYGIWAVVINADLLVAGEEFTIINLMLMLSHFGMAVEGVVYLRHLIFKKKDIYIAAMWFGMQDVMDYVFRLHPYLFSERQIVLAQYTAVTLTIVILSGIIVKMLSASRNRLQVG